MVLDDLAHTTVLQLDHLLRGHFRHSFVNAYAFPLEASLTNLVHEPKGLVVALQLLAGRSRDPMVGGIRQPLLRHVVAVRIHEAKNGAPLIVLLVPNDTDVVGCLDGRQLVLRLRIAHRRHRRFWAARVLVGLGVERDPRRVLREPLGTVGLL